MHTYIVIFNSIKYVKYVFINNELFMNIGHSSLISILSYKKNLQGGVSRLPISTFLYKGMRKPDRIIEESLLFYEKQ